jgi:uncharacterized membrane protein
MKYFEGRCIDTSSVIIFRKRLSSHLNAMKTIVTAYFSSLLAMLILDGVWLGITMKRFYAAHIGHLLAESPKLGPAAVFYPLYILGVTLLVVLPAVRAQAEPHKVFLAGALLGMMAYGTYDLTNQATLKDWPLTVTIVDLAWGTLLTGVVSLISVFFTRMIAN